MTRIAVNPELISWARERSGLAQEDLFGKFKKLPEWEDGETQPTLKQVEAFARAVHVPVGYLFLSEPPDESMPIPDFRTFAGEAVTRPSPNLLDTIYAEIGVSNPALRPVLIGRAATTPFLPESGVCVRGPHTGLP